MKQRISNFLLVLGVVLAGACSSLDTSSSEWGPYWKYYPIMWYNRDIEYITRQLEGAIEERQGYPWPGAEQAAVLRHQVQAILEGFPYWGSLMDDLDEGTITLDSAVIHLQEAYEEVEELRPGHSLSDTVFSALMQASGVQPRPKHFALLEFAFWRAFLEEVEAAAEPLLTEDVYYHQDARFQRAEGEPIAWVVYYDWDPKKYHQLDEVIGLQLTDSLGQHWPVEGVTQSNMAVARAACPPPGRYTLTGQLIYRNHPRLTWLPDTVAITGQIEVDE